MLKVSLSAALEPWKGRTSARWTLVDQFELDGKRYIVTQDNGRSPRGVLALTKTERSVVRAAARGQTTKEIAYSLGISSSTVRVLLMRAVRRCAVRDRKELLRLWETSSAPEPRPPK